jgi:polyphosphate kinase 2 (PPK2 family)
MAQAPLFERMIVDSGIHLTKLWFSVTQSEQRTRFIIRQVDPVRQWKLSPMDPCSPWTSGTPTRLPRKRCS